MQYSCGSTGTTTTAPVLRAFSGSQNGGRGSPSRPPFYSELIEHCRGKIASFKLPRHIRFVRDWPMSTSKIQKFRLRQQMIEELASLPGVRAVAQASKVPLSPGRSQGTFRLPAQEQTHEFDLNAVSPDYFAVLGLPIVGAERLRVQSSTEARGSR